jgi:hypothetical protein
MALEFEVDGELAELEAVLEELQSSLERCTSLERRKLIAQMIASVERAKSSVDTAAKVRALEVEVATARAAFEAFDVPNIIALLATERAIQNWHERGRPPHIRQIRRQWVAEARDEVARKLSSGLIDERVATRLRETAYTLTASDSGARQMAMTIRGEPLGIAFANALRAFDLGDRSQASDFRRQFRALALAGARDRTRIVDVISRGGDTTLGLLGDYLSEFRDSNKKWRSSPRPTIVRILMPGDGSSDRQWPEGIEEVLRYHNVYLWLRRTPTSSPIHGNVIRTLERPDATKIEPWWRGGYNEQDARITDLYLAMRRSSLDASPVYLYVPCTILGAGARRLGRGLAEDFDVMWSRARAPSGAPTRVSP